MNIILGQNHTVLSPEAEAVVLVGDGLTEEGPGPRLLVDLRFEYPASADGHVAVAVPHIGSKRGHSVTDRAHAAALAQIHALRLVADLIESSLPTLDGSVSVVDVTTFSSEGVCVEVEALETVWHCPSNRVWVVGDQERGNYLAHPHDLLFRCRRDAGLALFAYCQRIVAAGEAAQLFGRPYIKDSDEIRKSKRLPWDAGLEAEQRVVGACTLLYDDASDSVQAEAEVEYRVLGTWRSHSATEAIPGTTSTRTVMTNHKSEPVTDWRPMGKRSGWVIAPEIWHNPPRMVVGSRVLGPR